VSYALEVHELWKGYAVGVRGCSARVTVLRGVTFGVEPGERIGIVGAAGAGKTTLMHCIAGLRRPDAGHVVLAGLLAETLLLLDEESLDVSPGRDSPAALVFTRDAERLRGRVDRMLELREGRIVPLGAALEAGLGHAHPARQVAEPPPRGPRAGSR
jgi:ABC-type oligopeptide transport system ATPase subunit